MHALSFHSEFKHQITQYALDYNERREGYGLLFETEVLEALEKIAGHPKAWTPVKGRFHRFNLKRFPCTILYRIEPVYRVFILMIGHLHRGPEFWKSKFNQFKLS